MIQFTHEKVREVWREVLPLARAQWLEIEEHRHWQGFNPDIERYAKSEDVGIYFHFCARDNGRLVGSAGIYVTRSAHTQRVIASEDTFYLIPEYRGRGRNIIRFVEFTERFAVAHGAEQFMLTTSLVNLRAERVVQHCGYVQITKGWSKDLRPQHALKQRVA